ncbi:amidohydrolase family protein [Microlunatus sp. GCM10028923]|uniref:amidohydrolase family protein n=1 Tax=Microlunatus sp. GCM10028923 TaxID=3273400 RepID=UPI00360E1601
MINDAHIHLFRTGYGLDTAPDDELRHYLAIREAAGIDRAVVVGYEGLPQFRGNNDYVIAVARKHPWIVPLAYLDVTEAPAPATLDRLCEQGFAGFSLYLAGAEPGLDAWPANSLAALSGALLSVNADPPSLVRSEPVLAGLTRSTIMISHLGGPGTAIAGVGAAEAAGRLAPVLRLARHDQVRVKLSGLYAIDPQYPHRAAEGAVEALLAGTETGKLLWGSDFTPALQAVDPDQLTRLPDWLGRRLGAARPDVLGGNLAALLAPRS